MTRTEYQRQWKAENRNRLNAARREYRKLPHVRERENAYKREYNKRRRSENPEIGKQHYQTYGKPWRIAHWSRFLELAKSNYHNRRSRKILQFVSEVTVDKWLGRCSIYLWKCAYCNTSLDISTATMDHVIPLSRGGKHMPSNVVPACLACNVRKSTNIWIPRIGETLSES